MQVGFADQNYFDRRFKATFRQMPRLKTRVEGIRVVDMLSGERLPRIWLKFFWSARLARPILGKTPEKERRNDGNYNDHRINPESKRLQCMVRLTK